MSTNIAFKPISMFLTRPLQTLPTIWREPLRSTLYSSSRPFSSNATRRSSFSTLTTNLLPVLRAVRPKIFFTLSNIDFERLRDREPKQGQGIVHCSLDRHLIVKSDGAPETAPAGVPPVCLRKAVQKSLVAEAAVPEPHGLREAVWKLAPARQPRARHRARHCRSPFARRPCARYRRLLRPRCQDYFPCSSRILSIGADSRDVPARSMPPACRSCLHPSPMFVREFASRSGPRPRHRAQRRPAPSLRRHISDGQMARNM